MGLPENISKIRQDLFLRSINNDDSEKNLTLEVILSSLLCVCCCFILATSFYPQLRLRGPQGWVQREMKNSNNNIIVM